MPLPRDTPGHEAEGREQADCRIDAMLGEVRIGKRIHVGPFAILVAREPIVLEDYVGLGSSTKVYATSEYPMDGKRMSGPMIPDLLLP